MQKVIIIGGPTASGKSSLAIDLAKELDGIVINGDSMQIYQDTPILSAIPDQDEITSVPHKLFAIFPASHHGTVTEWLKLATKEITQAWDERKIPIIVGGSGMYLDALTNGMSPIPETSEQAKHKVAKLLSEIGPQGVYKLLPETNLNPNDTTRIRRAMEVFEDTGKPISVWHLEPNIKSLPEADFFTIKLLPSTEELDEKSFWRWDKMLEAGALEEVEKLHKQNLAKNLPAMKALGVPELIDYLDNKTSLTEASNLAKLHTRQYAKRQRTWFKNKMQADLTIPHCYHPDKKLINHIKKAIAQKHLTV